MKISVAQNQQSNEIFSIIENCKIALDSQRIFQWTGTYPSLENVEDDIHNGYLYCLMNNEYCVGIINISDIQEPEYASIAWECNEGKIMVIHRLAIAPGYQGKGLGRVLMDFAEDYGQQSGYSSIRLDAFSDNKRVLRFYEQRDYQKRGEVFFPGRQAPFYCYEKILTAGVNVLH